MTTLHDWPDHERIIQALIWIIIAEGSGKTTADRVCRAIAETDPTVPTDLVLYSIGILAGQQRIILTDPGSTLPEGAWALVKWTAVP